MSLTLIIGNKNYSSWSMRAALVLELTEEPYAEVRIPLYQQASRGRICALWADCRQRFGADGAFLFGHAGIADAFYAPVAARLRGYAVALPEPAAAYVETLYQWPAFQRWYQAALQETETIE